MKYFPVYGYHIEDEQVFPGFTLHPLENTDLQRRIKCHAIGEYHLTAILEITGDQNPMRLLYLQSILSFIDQREVRIPHQMGIDATSASAAAKIIKPHRFKDERGFGKNKIFPETPDANACRKNFTHFSLTAMLDESRTDIHEIRQLLQNCIFAFLPGAAGHNDVRSYFYLSALRNLADKTIEGNKPDDIALFLRNLGFQLVHAEQDMTTDDLARHHARLFATSDDPIQDNQSHLKQIAELVPLVLIRHLGFHDTQLRWGPWATSDVA